MDDFGRSLERDYGLGRANKGRIGTRSNRSSSKSLHHFENSTRFSDSFNGRHVVSHQEPSSSFREKSSSPRSWSNISRPSSYSVYDEVFSSNTQSTIPLFEDVFRVHSSRMKVSELRENDLFRGVSDFRRNGNRSRLTYEDIFAEAPPEEFFNPFNVVPGSKPSSSGRQSPAPAPLHEKKKERTVEKSSKSRSRSATPRKGSSGESSRSHAEAITQRPVEVEARNGDHHAALPKIQGSFLGMSQTFKREESFEKRDEPAVNNLQYHVESPASSSPDGVERAWLSIGEVSLVTKPSENPPPLRSAPGRSSSSKNSVDGGAALETAQADSGPPPLRVPPPIIDNAEQAHAQAEAEASTSGSSELLEKVLRERSAHGEISIREKVLDWQKQNLSQQQAEEERQRESFRRRAEALEKLRQEREEVERIAAEVEAAAAEQARVRAERAAAEELERDARAAQMKQEHEEEHQEETIQGSNETSRFVSEAKTVRDGSESGQTGVDDSPNLTYGASGDSAAAVESESKKFNSGCVQALSDSEKSRPGEGGEGTKAASQEGNREEDEGSGDIPAATQVPTEEAVPEANTDNESSIGIDTISSTSDSGPAKQEPAPETPERSEELHARHEKSSKSSEVELLGEEQEEKHKSSSTQQEEGGASRRREGRSLVARITEEVKERAAASENRRTKPRLKQDEVVGKEREDHSRRSGGARVSLREQLEKERLARLERSKNELQPQPQPQPQQQAFSDREAGLAAEAKLRAERSLVERITAEVRERAAASARAEQERAEKEREREQERLAREAAEQKERERLQRLNRARERERERLERLEKEREKERERLERELELEREIEREKDRVGLEEKAAKERAEAEAEAARIKMERAAVERATAEARARAERAAYERVANGFSESSSRPASVPKQRFGNSVSMPTAGSVMENGIRRTTSSTNLESERYSSSSNSREFQQEFQEIKGETPERRKARLERYHRTLNRAAQALAQKNKRDLELQSEQAERQRLAERLDADIKRWSVGKDGNIRALLSTLQYVLWPESGWKQVTLTELISPAAVKKAYRRATLCVHPDKMQQKHANVQQKYIAEKVFHILQVAWNKFNSHEAL